MSNNRPAPHLRQFAPVKYKKAPQAPRRFKSSYMFFSTKKHKEIRAELAEKGEGNKVSELTVALSARHAPSVFSNLGIFLIESAFFSLNLCLHVCSFLQQK